MSSLTPEQRAKIGRIKAAWRALVDRAVDELLREPHKADRAEFPNIGLDGGEVWWGDSLDTPE
jgi:hypothetical protein